MRCPDERVTVDVSADVLVLVRWRRRSVLVFVVLRRHGIDAAEPAIEIDVGAAPAAERAEFFRPRFAADRTEWNVCRLALRHGIDMGAHIGVIKRPKWKPILRAMRR